jgi:hypothetical protein
VPTSPEPMGDKVGALLQLGDTVLFIKTGFKKYTVMVAKVVGFTAAMVKLKATEIELGPKPKLIETNRAPTSLIQTNDLQAASLEWLKEQMNAGKN